MSFATQIVEGLGRCSVVSCCGLRTLNELAAGLWSRQNEAINNLYLGAKIRQS